MNNARKFAPQITVGLANSCINVTDLTKIGLYVRLTSTLSKIDADFWQGTKISFGFKSLFAEAINVSLFWNYSVSHFNLHLKSVRVVQLQTIAGFHGIKRIQDR